MAAKTRTFLSPQAFLCRGFRLRQLDLRGSKNPFSLLRTRRRCDSRSFAIDKVQQAVAGWDTSVVGVFFLWWPMLSMSMVEINVAKLLEFFQASYRQLLHLFSQG
jgi:hypothetical protein